MPPAARYKSRSLGADSGLAHPLSLSSTVPGTTEMKKLLAAMIAASFACGVAYAADAPKDAKKPTADECKKAMEAKKELAGCEKPKDAAPKK